MPTSRKVMKSYVLLEMCSTEYMVSTCIDLFQENFSLSPIFSFLNHFFRAKAEVRQGKKINATWPSWDPPLDPPRTQEKPPLASAFPVSSKALCLAVSEAAS